MSQRTIDHIVKPATGRHSGGKSWCARKAWERWTLCGHRAETCQWFPAGQQSCPVTEGHPAGSESCVVMGQPILRSVDSECAGRVIQPRKDRLEEADSSKGVRTLCATNSTIAAVMVTVLHP